MAARQEAVTDFLEQKRIAVAGVSRTKNDAANLIYKKLRDSGYQVFAVNPHAATVEGDTCYPDLRSIPDGVDGVVIVTRPDTTRSLVGECVELGIDRVWMHRSFGQGSVADDAVQICREAGIRVIPGGCPMMHCQPVDIGHKCMRWVLGLTRRLPRPG